MLNKFASKYSSFKAGFICFCSDCICPARSLSIINLSMYSLSTGRSQLCSPSCRLPKLCGTVHLERRHTYARFILLRDQCHSSDHRVCPAHSQLGVGCQPGSCHVLSLPLHVFLHEKGVSQYILVFR